MTQSRSWDDPRRVLKRHGARPSRRYSQNFLTDRHAVERIALAAAAEPRRLVVELGAGVGTLTRELLRDADRVTAVDKDPAMLRILEAELGEHSGLDIVDADATTFDFTELSAREKAPLCVTGNLPYAVTGRILRNLIEHRAAIARAVLMVQREVRNRLIASPGTKDYGALTVFVQAAFSVDTLMRLKPGAFHPAPEVESAVVIFEPLAEPRAAIDPAFEEVVRAAFQMRRKTLKNALGAAGSPERATLALREARIDGKRRGETLSVEEFAALACAWQKAAAR